MNLSRSLPIAIASACIGALAMMAMQARPAQAQMQVMPAPVQVAAPVQQPVQPQQVQQPAQAQTGEQQLNTGNTAPLFQQANLKTSTIHTTSDEHLPKWVPKRGRLSVVDSSDLAENLGLVPKGSSKKADERISVADKLAEQDAARTAARQNDPNNYQTSFSYSKAGRFRSKL